MTDSWNNSSDSSAPGSASGPTPGAEPFSPSWDSTPSAAPAGWSSEPPAAPEPPVTPQQAANPAADQPPAWSAPSNPAEQPAWGQPPAWGQSVPPPPGAEQPGPIPAAPIAGTPTWSAEPPPAAYGGAPYGAPPDNYLVWGILATLFCCLPLGIPSIVFASQVNSKWTAGDVAGAQDASRKARQFALWSFIVGLVSIAAYFGFIVLAGAGNWEP